MRVEVDSAKTAGKLSSMASTLRGCGGFIAADFTVHESDGEFWCSIGDRIGESGRVLVDYPFACTVPLHLVAWADQPELLNPVGGLERLSPVQRSLLTDWVALVNEAGKLARIRESAPQFAIDNPQLRELLAQAGYPQMREVATDAGVRRTLFARHSMVGAHPGGSRSHRRPVTPA